MNRVVLPSLSMVALVPVAHGAAAQPSAVPDPLSMGSLLQVLAGLAAVLLVFAGLVLLLRRLGGMRGFSGKRLRVIEAMSLGARDRLVLLRVGGSDVLLGMSPGRIQTLHVMPAGADEDVPESSPDFAARLRRTLDGQRGPGAQGGAA